ncbi:MAG: hypothetical protein ACREOU_09485 [Candidatus Eiseniibacteriota bacterium]
MPLDSFIPHPYVRERFETTIRAPAALVLGVARSFDMQSPPLVRAIIRLRERFMGAQGTPRTPRGLVDEMLGLGWGLLVDRPGELVIMGASCQPWLPDVVFTAVPSAHFRSYAEPDRVKIAWTLEARELDLAVTRFGQETRVVATDGGARIKFRNYWRWARFGIVAIRLVLLPEIRKAAEREWRRGGGAR